jgi:hypothetical protein
MEPTNASLPSAFPEGWYFVTSRKALEMPHQAKIRPAISQLLKTRSRAAFGAVRLRAPIMNRIMASFERRDVLQDVPIWSTKSYRSRPRLARSDGEIMRYRAYCTQFYTDQPAAAGDTETIVDLRPAADG